MEDNGNPWRWYAFSIKGGVEGLFQIPYEWNKLANGEEFPKLIRFKRLTYMSTGQGKISFMKWTPCTDAECEGLVPGSAFLYLAVPSGEILAAVERAWGIQSIIPANSSSAEHEVEKRKRMGLI